MGYDGSFLLVYAKATPFKIRQDGSSELFRIISSWERRDENLRVLYDDDFNFSIP